MRTRWLTPHVQVVTTHKPTFILLPEAGNSRYERLVFLPGARLEQNRIPHVDDLISSMDSTVITTEYYVVILKTRAAYVA